MSGLNTGFRMDLAPRQLLRMECKLSLGVDAPPDAARGFAGLSIAHDICQSLDVAGLIIGGVARAAWSARERSAVSARKDVDVIVLSLDPARHPTRFEGGIDWWCTTDLAIGPINGNGVELIYAVKVETALKPGLHLCPFFELADWRAREKKAFASERRVAHIPQSARSSIPIITEYPAIPLGALKWQFTQANRWSAV